MGKNLLQALIWPGISPLKGNFQFYKLKELWWIDYSKDGYGADALIYFLKLCPALETLFVTVGFSIFFHFFNKLSPLLCFFNKVRRITFVNTFKNELQANF